jgi:hypothetical protein
MRGGGEWRARVRLFGMQPLHRKSSYSAKAEYPVRRGFSIPSLALRNTGSPAFAGDDGRSVVMLCESPRIQFSRVSIWLVPQTGLEPATPSLGNANS